MGRYKSWSKYMCFNIRYIFLLKSCNEFIDEVSLIIILLLSFYLVMSILGWMSWRFWEE